MAKKPLPYVFYNQTYGLWKVNTGAKCGHQTNVLFVKKPAKNNIDWAIHQALKNKCDNCRKNSR